MMYHNLLLFSHLRIMCIVGGNYHADPEQTPRGARRRGPPRPRRRCACVAGSWSCGEISLTRSTKRIQYKPQFKDSLMCISMVGRGKTMQLACVPSAAARRLDEFCATHRHGCFVYNDRGFVCLGGC